jgi:hypothetical protein
LSIANTSVSVSGSSSIVAWTMSEIRSSRGAARRYVTLSAK